MIIPASDAETIASCAASAAQRYQVDGGLVQDWLKPTTLLLLDGLLGETPAENLWAAVNNMQKNEDRIWAGSLSRVHVEPYEVLVDFHYFSGARTPYRTVLTAESEGYAPAVRHLANMKVPGPEEDWPNNGLVWDLWKLLIVPSPLRVFTTVASATQYEVIARHFAALLDRYADAVPADAPFALVCFDPDGTFDASARVARWAGGEWKAPPSTAVRRLAGPK